VEAEAIYAATHRLRHDAASWDELHRHVTPLAARGGDGISFRRVWRVATELQALGRRLEWCTQRVRRLAGKPHLWRSRRWAAECADVLHLAAAAHQQCLAAVRAAVGTAECQDSRRQVTAQRSGSQGPLRSATRVSLQQPMAQTSSSSKLHVPEAKRAGVVLDGSADVIPAVWQQQEKGVRREARGGGERRRALGGRGTPCGPGKHRHSRRRAQAAPKPVVDTAATQQSPHTAQMPPNHEGWGALPQQGHKGDTAAALAAAQGMRGGGDAAAREARTLLQSAVASGCAAACVILGQMAEAGEGLAGPDAAEAVEWYARGAALGDAEAAHLYGCALEHGVGELYCGRNSRLWLLFYCQEALPHQKIMQSTMMQRSVNRCHAAPHQVLRSQCAQHAHNACPPRHSTFRCAAGLCGSSRVLPIVGRGIMGAGN
jgi:hypothetical protein